MTDALPIGQRVRHYGQQWHRARCDGTGNIIDVKGPYHDGAYEYLVRLDKGFSGEPDPGEPTWWASYMTIPIKEPT